MGGGMSGGGGGYFKGTKGAGSGRNTTVHEGRQGKHIVGHNNYIEGNSRFYGTSKDAQALIDKYAGTGTKINDNKERIDFERVIGQYYSIKTHHYYDTTMGMIHYSTKGCHIVPATPKDWEDV